MDKQRLREIEKKTEPKFSELSDIIYLHLTDGETEAQRD